MLQLIDSSDESVTVYLAETYDEQSLARITWLAQQVREQLSEQVTDVVPSYCSLTVYYDVTCTNYRSFCDTLMRLAESSADQGRVAQLPAAAREIQLPVYYGAEAAPDLERVADFAGLSIEETIALHSGADYRVYALGFRPGFAFMGRTPEPLQVPRLDNPRTKVPAGAVAIAGPQAAVYPEASPGGWNLIGRCPLPMFDRSTNPPQVRLAAGDRVRFVPVDREAYLSAGGVLDD